MVAYDLLMVLMSVVLSYAIALPLIFFGYKLTIAAKEEAKKSNIKLEQSNIGNFKILESILESLDIIELEQSTQFKELKNEIKGIQREMGRS